MLYDSETLVGSTVKRISSCVTAAAEIGATQDRFMNIKAVLADPVSVLVKGSVARQPYGTLVLVVGDFWA